MREVIPAEPSLVSRAFIRGAFAPNNVFHIHDIMYNGRVYILQTYIIQFLAVCSLSTIYASNSTKTNPIPIRVCEYHSSHLGRQL